MGLLHGGSDGKKSACSAGDRIWSLGRTGPLEKGMATHSSIPAWRISWTEEPGGLQSMGSQRVRHNFVTKSSIFLSTSDSLPVFWIFFPLIFLGCSSISQYFQLIYFSNILLLINLTFSSLWTLSGLSHIRRLNVSLFFLQSIILLLITFTTKSL